MEFRRKPITTVVQAMRVPVDNPPASPTQESGRDMEAWSDLILFLGIGGHWYITTTSKGPGVEIRSSPGRESQTAMPGYWILKLPEERFQVVDPQTFEDTYELVG